MRWNMARLKVTAKGQVTLRKEVLKHLGIGPGDEIEFEVRPGGKIEMQAAPAIGSWDGFIGSLAGKTKKVATIEEIKEATERAWAGER
jgi:AbrB family looped-hinge helix DNA binding protein